MMRPSEPLALSPRCQGENRTWRSKSFHPQQIVHLDTAEINPAARLVEDRIALRQQFLQHLPVHVGQPIIPTLEAERQPCVIEAQQVQ